MPIPTRIPSPLKATQQLPNDTRHVAQDGSQLQQDRRKPQLQIPRPRYQTKSKDVSKDVGKGDIGRHTGHARSASTVEDEESPTTATLDASRAAKPKSTVIRGGVKASQGQARIPARERPINALSAAQKSSSGGYDAPILTGRFTNASSKASRGNHALGALKRPEFDISKTQSSTAKPKTTTTSLANVHQVASTDVSEVDAQSRNYTALNDELLQLSLLYGESTASAGRFSRSICEQLNTRYSAIEAQARRVGLLVREHSSVVNMRAMDKLAQGSSLQDGPGPAPLSILAECLQEVDRLTCEDGLLECVMSQFQAWQELTLAASRDRVEAKSDEMILVPPLEVQWWHSLQILESKLKFCSVSLDVLDFPKDNSSVAALIEMVTKYVEHSIQEIDLCKTVAGMSMRREQDWVATAIAEAIAEGKADHMQGMTNGVRKGVWETL
ncbi:hypothetical protein PV10_01030 [Exophiala mesophila]|uniref:Uncharacterized protein n=1 Tax=Exophiala mesophila TaxID=212818 RepID=A0A0D1ZRM6_EXOME|nr:uncharacterized protein PV10_01030 [Exophiala mesophila]KIV97262.1 hypothetical protein PV10_01030 [Exophiala mesophila]